MRGEKLSIREMIQINCRGISLIFKLVRWNLPFCCITAFLDVLYSYWSYIFLAKLVDDIVGKALRTVIVKDAILLVGGYLFVQMVFEIWMHYYFYCSSNIWEQANAHLNRKIMNMDYEYMESEHIQNMRRDIDAMARNDGGGMNLLFWYITPVIEKIITLVEKLRENVSVATGAIEAAISGFVYFILGVMVLKNAITIGSVCLYAGCISNFLLHFREWISQLTQLAANTKYVKMYFGFLDIPGKKYEGTLPVEKRDDDRFLIEFRHVSFRYPGSETDVLKDFSIKFQIGERLAVVGKNGSGKTTFIKLLCRLYDPTEGEILLNGIDIRKFDHKEYLSLFSVVFQDFKIPALPLGGNVAVSSEYDEEKVRFALERVGLGGLIQKMPSGLETPVYTDFDKNGVDISGGEAQKVAIARALYHDTPFVILDEPTVALDALAEYEIYSKFDDLVGTKTAVYISHRLSSCQFCNDILVIDKGKAVQRGSHADLIQEKEGLYYTLWNTQAQYYQPH